MLSLIVFSFSFVQGYHHHGTDIVPSQPEGQCAEFCNNQKFNCRFMPSLCGGCPACSDLKEADDIVSLLMKNANVAADVQKLMSLNPSSSKSISDHESNEETQPLNAPREPSVGQCAGFCANQPENCITMHESCGGCPVCESNKEPQPQEDAPTERSLNGLCAGFCHNPVKASRCKTMSLWCNGCPMCRRLSESEESNKEPQPLDAPTQSISDGTDAVPSQPEGQRQLELRSDQVPLVYMSSFRELSKEKDDHAKDTGVPVDEKEVGGDIHV